MAYPYQPLHDASTQLPSASMPSLNGGYVVDPYQTAQPGEPAYMVGPMPSVHGPYGPPPTAPVGYAPGYGGVPPPNRNSGAASTSTAKSTAKSSIFDSVVVRVGSLICIFLAFATAGVALAFSLFPVDTQHIEPYVSLLAPRLCSILSYSECFSVEGTETSLEFVSYSRYASIGRPSEPMYAGYFDNIKSSAFYAVGHDRASLDRAVGPLSAVDRPDTAARLLQLPLVRDRQGRIYLPFEDVMRLFPEAVSPSGFGLTGTKGRGNATDHPGAINMDVMFAIAVATVQDLSHQLEAQQARLDLLPALQRMLDEQRAAQDALRADVEALRSVVVASVPTKADTAAELP